MILTVKTPPTTEPITLAEAKAHLRVDFPDDDAYISALISAARDYAEGFQGRTLAEATLELTLDYFPRGLGRASRNPNLLYESSPIRLPRTPVSSVESVQYRLADGVTVKTLPTSDYIVKRDGDIIPGWSKYWPFDYLVPGDGVTVTYKAGYPPNKVPQATKQGMLILIGHWYENREPVAIGKTVAKIPTTAESLLWLDRSW